MTRTVEQVKSLKKKKKKKDKTALTANIWTESGHQKPLNPPPPPKLQVQLTTASEEGTGVSLEPVTHILICTGVTEVYN